MARGSLAPTPSDDPIRIRLEQALRPGDLLQKLNDSCLDAAGLPEVAGAKTRRVYYKPFQRARLVVELLLRGTGTARDSRQFVFLQLYPNLSAARRRLSYYLDKPPLPCFGPPAFLVEEWCAAGFSLPNGPRLRKLGYFFDSSKISGLMDRRGLLPGGGESYRAEDLELLRYVPRKRALLRYAPSTAATRLYIKLYTTDDFNKALRNMRAIRKAQHKGHLGFVTPALAATSKRRRAIFMEEVPGEVLTSYVPRTPLAVAEAVGAALGSLHGSGLRPKARWRAQDELILVNRAAEDLKAALPGLTPEVDGVLETLDSRLGVAEGFVQAPIHANLFGDQILVDGENVGIVDWDDLARGDPCFDAGRLIAHVLYQSYLERDDDEPLPAGVIHRLLQGHQRTFGESLPENRLSWHIAAGLVMRAKISALRTLSPGWPRLVACALHDASEILRNRTLLPKRAQHLP